MSFQEYSFQITLRQQWNDKRLRFDKILTSRGVDLGEHGYKDNYNEKKNTERQRIHSFKEVGLG